MNAEQKKEVVTNIKYQLRMIEGLLDTMLNSPASREMFITVNMRCKRLVQLCDDAIKEIDRPSLR